MNRSDLLFIKYLCKKYLITILPLYLILNLINNWFYFINSYDIIFISFSLVLFNQIGLLPGLFTFLGMSKKKPQQLFFYTNLVSLATLTIILLLDFFLGGVRVSIFETSSSFFIILLLGNYISVSKLSFFGILFNLPIGTLSIYFLAYNVVLYFFNWWYIPVSLVILIAFFKNEKPSKLLLTLSKYFFYEKDAIALKNLRND